MQYLRKVPNGQAYIQGPPGSGRAFLTTSIIHVALILRRRIGKKIQILVVAHSNSALNHVVHAFDWVYTDLLKTLRYLCAAGRCR